MHKLSLCSDCPALVVPTHFYQVLNIILYLTVEICFRNYQQKPHTINRPPLPTYSWQTLAAKHNLDNSVECENSLKLRCRHSVDHKAGGNSRRVRQGKRCKRILSRMADWSQMRVSERDVLSGSRLERGRIWLKVNSQVVAPQHL